MSLKNVDSEMPYGAHWSFGIGELSHEVGRTRRDTASDVTRTVVESVPERSSPNRPRSEPISADEDEEKVPDPTDKST